MSPEDKLVQARRQGLATNPTVPAALLRQLVTGADRSLLTCLREREEWTEEQIEALISHPEVEVRKAVAAADHLDPEQRARLVEDPEVSVLWALAGDETPPLPLWAYQRLVERRPALRFAVTAHPRVPQATLDALGLGTPDSEPSEPPPLSRAEAERLAGHADERTRAQAAADPRLPGDLVARLAVDPAESVRLAVSMRQELTEEQRAAIDYQVRPTDRISPARWACETADPREQRRCIASAHAGLRRSVVVNPHLSPELLAELAAPEDEVVRMLMVQTQAAAPAETVLWVYARHLSITHTWLPSHPGLAGYPFARLAADPYPRLRALVTKDPATAPEVVERLSHDPDPTVRTAMARDGRLPVGRVLELLEDDATAEGAAANPRLPRPVMESITSPSFPGRP